MTLQNDLARPWFEPVVPTEGRQDQPQPTRGPLKTRIAGELPLDEIYAGSRPRTEQSTPDDRVDEPAQVEVTQPYIPAIRDEQPEFAKRLNPEPQLSPEPETRLHIETPAPPAAQPDTPVTPEPAEPTVRTAEPATAAPAAPAAPVKKRSWVRRVVRRIIGPDLLRKDPPKPK